MWLGNKPVNDCIACGKCAELGGKCVIANDVVNELIAKAAQADGFVFGTPVYYAHPSGRILCALDRAFYAGGAAFRHKPGAAVAVARRGGTHGVVRRAEQVLHLLRDARRVVHVLEQCARAPAGQAAQDAEGMQTMRNIGQNMAWLLKCIEAGKAAGIDVPRRRARPDDELHPLARAARLRTTLLARAA